MTARKILTLGKHEKLLRTPSEPVKKINREVKELIQDIKDTFADNPAIGLAAVQIGALKRIFAARMGYDPEKSKEDGETPDPAPIIFINPEIIAHSEARVRDHDGCLSIPGMWAETQRYQDITLRYMDETGQKQEQAFSGWDARVIQHELDHLDGILFLDRLDSLDDLMVVMRNAEGKTKTVRYTDALRRAESSTEGAQLPNIMTPKK
jgi:peptide deformylase